MSAVSRPGGSAAVGRAGRAPRSYPARWRAAIAEELADQGSGPRPVLEADSLGGLPDPVRRYVLASGAVGRPVPTNLRLVFDAVMRRAPGERGMRATSTQLNWLGRPARLFLMHARMFGLPVQALHVYRGSDATFQVRVAGLLTMVDHAGETISSIETVTVLNDLCAYAPGALVDPRLAWQPIDDRSASVTFTNGPRRVSATLVFGDADELVDFWSDDRPESIDGRLVPTRWRTPMSGHRLVDGRRVPTRALAVYDRADGPFVYGEFTLREAAWDVDQP